VQRNQLADIIAFLAVARDRSFTQAAARLGVTQSAISHAVRRLEERLGLRLVNRTTRTLALSEAGIRLAASLKPAFDDIQTAIASLANLREKPAGIIRITTSHRPAQNLIMPVASRLMQAYPDITIEISVDTRLVDIVGEGFDCGVRLGEDIEKDMIALRIGPNVSMAVVGSPDYFDRNPKPQTPYDLTEHNCINMRLATRGNLYLWEFEKEGKPLNVHVKGQFIGNEAALILAAARAGVGLTCLPDNEVAAELEAGQLIRVLEDWCPSFPGYHLYYPSRRQHPPAFALFLEALIEARA